MACEVPRTKVYHTLKKLIDLGLVVEVPGKTKSFTAVAPDISLNSNLLVIKKRAEEFESIVGSLAETYRRKQLVVEPQKVDVWVIQGREKILNRMRDLLSDAKRSVEVVTNENGGALLFKAANKLLDKLKEEGVKTTILSPLDPKKQALARELNYICKVKKIDFKLPLLYICVDHRQFILSRMIPNNLEMKSEYDMGIFSEDTSLLTIVNFLLKQEPPLSSYMGSR